MIVCHCHVVNDHAVRRAVASGASDVDGVSERCGAASSCTNCVPAVEDLIAEAVLALRAPDELRTRQRRRRVSMFPALAPGTVA